MMCRFQKLHRPKRRSEALQRAIINHQKIAKPNRSICELISARNIYTPVLILTYLIMLL